MFPPALNSLCSRQMFPSAFMLHNILFVVSKQAVFSRTRSCWRVFSSVFLGWLWFSAAVGLKERGHFINDSRPFLRNHIVAPEKSIVISCLYVSAFNNSPHQSWRKSTGFFCKRQCYTVRRFYDFQRKTTKCSGSCRFRNMQIHGQVALANDPVWRRQKICFIHTSAWFAL